MAAASRVARLRTWIWALVYGGLVGFGIGMAVRRTDEPLGWAFAGLGAAAVGVGILLIWFRSRLDDDEMKR